jgi:ABC-2 type transport system permease protein
MVSAPQDDPPIVQFLNIFWIPVFFVVPLLTMRSIAEERNAGTLETLMTTPTSSITMVLSKFLGAYSFYMLLWLFALSFPLIISKFFPSIIAGGQLLEIEPIVGGFVFLALSGIFFVSIGIFASSVTRSQLVAAMFCFTAIFVAIIGGQEIGSIAQNGIKLPFGLNDLVNYLQVFNHLEDFSRGVIDTRPFFYYTSTGIFFLGLATLMTEARK